MSNIGGIRTFAEVCDVIQIELCFPAFDSEHSVVG